MTSAFRTGPRRREIECGDVGEPDHKFERRTPAGSQVPVARPAGRPAPAVPVDVPDPPLEWEWWTPEALKGWAGSVTLARDPAGHPGLLVFRARD